LAYPDAIETMEPSNNPLLAKLNIRPGETEPLLILLAHSFMNGLCAVFLETAASSFFLSKYDVTMLPYVYIATAGVSVACGLLYARFESRLRLRQLLPGLLAFLALVLGGLYAAIVVFGNRELYLALMVWKEVHFALLFMEYWMLAGLIFNSRQGKRLFGLAAAGQIVASMLGGLAVPLITKHFAVLNLLLLSEISLVFALATAWFAARRLDDDAAEDAEGTAAGDGSMRALLKNRYLRSLV